MCKRLKTLVLTVILMSVCGGAFAADPYAHIPAVYWTQSEVLRLYLQQVPTTGKTPTQVWTDNYPAIPVDFATFQTNLAMVVAVSDPARISDFIKDVDGTNGVNLIPVFQALTDGQAAQIINQIQIFGFTADQATAMVAAARAGSAGGVTEAEAAQFLAMLGAAVNAAMRENMEETLRRNIGGFSPFSAPIILSRNMMKGKLRGASPVSGSAWGVNTWMQNSQLDEGTDVLSLGGQPYMRKVKDNLTWSVGAPVLYANLEDINNDDQWSGGLDGSVEYGLDNGVFIGFHGAFVDNYAEMLDKDNFLSLSGGPYLGMTHTIDEKLALTAMALTEGISTEKTDDTWYVAGGGGVSYRVTKAVTVNLFGLYYANMDTYTPEDDRDFFEVGVGAEAAVAKDTALLLDFSTFYGIQHVHSYTISLGLTRGF